MRKNSIALSIACLVLWAVGSFAGNGSISVSNIPSLLLPASAVSPRTPVWSASESYSNGTYRIKDGRPVCSVSPSLDDPPIVCTALGSSIPNVDGAFISAGYRNGQRQFKLSGGDFFLWRRLLPVPEWTIATNQDEPVDPTVYAVFSGPLASGNESPVGNYQSEETVASGYTDVTESILPNIVSGGDGDFWDGSTWWRPCLRQPRQGLFVQNCSTSAYVHVTFTGKANSGEYLSPSSYMQIDWNCPQGPVWVQSTESSPTAVYYWEW